MAVQEIGELDQKNRKEWNTPPSLSVRKFSVKKIPVLNSY